jgi:glycine cleavage system aminomethyltransferase T
MPFAPLALKKNATIAATVLRMTTETIIALSTPPGVAALAVIRLSGPESRAIIDSFVKEKWSGSRAGRLPHAHAQGAGARRRRADVLAAAPHSYTGEDTVEISCHGNPHIVENIVARAWNSARARRGPANSPSALFSTTSFRSPRRRACSTCSTRRRNARWPAPAR